MNMQKLLLFEIQSQSQRFKKNALRQMKMEIKIPKFMRCSTSRAKREAINVSIKKQEKYQINNLALHLNTRKRMKPKVSRNKEITRKSE